MDRQLQHSFLLNFLESVTTSSSLFIRRDFRNELVSLSDTVCLECTLDTVWLFTCFLSPKVLLFLLPNVNEFWMSLTNSLLVWSLIGISIWFSLSPFLINPGLICSLFSASLEILIVFRSNASVESVKFCFSIMSLLDMCFTNVKVVPSDSFPSVLIILLVLELALSPSDSSWCSSVSINLPAKLLLIQLI